jgi:hypothetical protein
MVVDQQYSNAHGSSSGSLPHAARQGEFDGCAGARPRFERKRSIHAIGPLAHNMKADMLIPSLGDFARIEATAIISNRHFEITSIADGNLHLSGLRMLTDIGKRLLQDEQYLQLLFWR